MAMKKSNTPNQLNKITSVFFRLTEPKELQGFFSNAVVAIPRILAGFMLATMFGGDKFGVPWSFSDSGLGLFEVAGWFPEDVAKFGFPFSVAPVLFAWIGAASEAIGGMLLLLGFQTRISGFLISCTMLVAIFFQKLGGPIWEMLPAMGFLWVSLYAMAFGSGKFGLDYLISKKLKTASISESSQTKNAPITSALGFVLLMMFMNTSSATAQVRGNGSIKTQEISVESFSSIKNGLSCNINIKVGEDRSVKVTVDENLIEWIDIEVVDGELNIDQMKWIEATRKITIEITTPDLTKFYNSAHGRYSISGINADAFNVMSPVGNVILEGNAKELSIGTEVGTIDALNLTAEKASLKIWSWGTIKVNAIERIDANVSDNGKVVYAKEPEVLKTKTKQAGKVISVEEDNAPAKEIVYINVKVKNNSDGRVNVVIKGPEGARFGYGAPFNSFQTRKERFPVGTEIYQERLLAKNKLLLVIKEEDAGKTVNLFQD